ncbi:MAG: serine/threonine-protein kinase PknK, partial [Deltaproteobacteria bacterium]|nr:serine/threonine-protein kinase PknK [Deltaproteobacteria bacterium]
MLKGVRPRTRDLARYRHEFELLSSLDLSPVIKVHDIKEYQNTLVLILEDFHAESIKKLLKVCPFSLEEVLRIFITVAEALHLLHENHILHQDVNPSNIVCNRQTGVCKLIDFGLAVRLSPTNPGHRQPNSLRGTLAYISPEQTGRMNHQVDYRSDLYSLGVSMYELMTGRLPFEKTNSVEMVHAHIASPVPRATEVNPNIPSMLSEIVAKLMAKTAEQRYQSAAGLRTDLETCLKMMSAGKRIESFELGRDDQFDTLYLPQKLYGRSRETAKMLDAFREHVIERQGKAFFLVSGYPGTGKTSLVKELQVPVSASNGNFIDGKFDQYKRTIPYFALKQALARLVDGWLAESEDRLATIAETLREALGQAGHVMVDLVPSLELLIGPQPEVPELSGVAAQNRFNYVCRNFFRSAATVEHPLVLFIDDLQWADLASLNLLSLLLTDSQMRHLFLIGAYRDSETYPSHPLMLLLAELAKQDVWVETIQIGNLSENDLTGFCADALHSEPKNVARLAHLIHTKTLGNPFFATQFLKALYSDGLISFTATGKEWNWRIEEIERRNIPDDVVQLMAAKIGSLAPQTQKLLTMAACIGNSFALDTLVVINEGSEESTQLDLTEAVSEGLLIRYDLRHYKFPHDRIQQAAYSLMEDNERMHLRIGRLLLKNSGPDPADEDIFEIVNQLDAAQRLITDETERLELAGLNQEAGRRAKNGAAYASALKYLSVAQELLPQNGWRDHYNLTFSINSDLAWCRFYAGVTDEIEELFSTLLSQAKSLDDAIEVHLIRMEYYHLQGAYAKAIE